MEYEIRFYYPLSDYEKILKQLKEIKELNYDGKNYEITSQFDHPMKEFSFYSQAIDGRFRVRKTVGEKASKCMISWKKRLKHSDTSEKFNMEEEVELSIKPEEYENLMFIINNVLRMNKIEVYERYRTVFKNEEIEIVLDQYPFGLALEIEVKKGNLAPNEIIDKYVKKLSLSYEDAYKLSWDDKYEELCKAQNIKKHNEVLFDKEMPSIK